MDRWWTDECVWAAGRWMKDRGRKSGRVSLMVIDGRMAGLMKESADGWRDGHELISGWISRCVNVWTDRRRMNGWMKWLNDELMVGWRIRGWMDMSIGGHWMNEFLVDKWKDDGWMNLVMDGWMDAWWSAGWVHCLNERMTQRDGSMGEWMEEVDALFSNRMWDRCMNHRVAQRILGWRDELLNGLINTWINFSPSLLLMTSSCESAEPPVSCLVSCLSRRTDILLNPSLLHVASDRGLFHRRPCVQRSVWLCQF